jgi:hypothetical protein
MKQLEAIHAAADPHGVGDGFLVRSAFTYDGLGRELSPFLLLDHGPRRHYGASERRRGVGPHPHRGFETVTVAYRGEVEHRDSSGGGGVIGPGDVQWMTAGAGVVHEESHSTAFSRSGGTMEMVQLWVYLPARFKRAPPAYPSLAAGAIPSVPLAGGAGSAKVIAGEARILVMSGEPIVGYGPFVMNTGTELLQAIDDYERGRIGALAAE